MLLKQRFTGRGIEIEVPPYREPPVWLEPFRPGHPRRATDPRMTVRTTLPRTGVAVTLNVEVDDTGTPHCRGLTADGDITYAALRELAVQKLMRDALRVRGTFEVSGSDGVYRIDPSTPSEVDATFRKPRRGARVTDDQLREIADLYRQAVEVDYRPHGRLAPTAWVCAKAHITRPTASRWIALARKRGFLPQPQQGRPTA